MASPGSTAAWDPEWAGCPPLAGAVLPGDVVLASSAGIGSTSTISTTARYRTWSELVDGGCGVDESLDMNRSLSPAPGSRQRPCTRPARGVPGPPARRRRPGTGSMAP
jgi:hypothetical protein